MEVEGAAGGGSCGTTISGRATQRLKIEPSLVDPRRSSAETGGRRRQRTHAGKMDA